MSRTDAHDGDGRPFGPWNPGLASELPAAFRHLVTAYRPENIENALGEVLELSDFSGLPPRQLVLFRAERLMRHEVLIRVMADLHVPMGTVYADLGVNFRAMVGAILEDAIDPRTDDVVRCLRDIRGAAAALVDRELDRAFRADDRAIPRADGGKRGWRSLFAGSGRGRPAAAPGHPDTSAHVLACLDGWRRGADGADDALERSTYRALHVAVSRVFARQQMLARRDLISVMARTLVSNEYGSARIGRLIEPWIHDVVVRRGYRRLRPQDRPVVMNVKGASASGKSTIRPYQRALVDRLGMDWADFALITPDVWRKFLLDYDSLGPARRYAGTLTGYEVEIVDRKLDDYMALKAREGRISHLLIDRFRFDSFPTEAASDTGSHLLTRFGDRIYIQFMITPPDATVVRAWKRGEVFGRYKAVDDLLAHNVEAYTGIPRLFFTWALSRDKGVSFEFLDNSVPEGHVPRTIAFGSNDVMNVFDVAGLVNIDRFKRINIYADDADGVYRGIDLTPEHNVTFLLDCIRRIATVRFACAESGAVYARFDGGRLSHLDPASLRGARALADVGPILDALGIREGVAPGGRADAPLVRDDACTLGMWGRDAARPLDR